MSDSPDITAVENGSQIVDHDLIDESIQDALTGDKAGGAEALPPAVRDVIACKIANIIDGMEGIKKLHNRRYPAHSIDQVVSAVSPLVSEAGLRVKTEVLSIERFTVLHDMPFWRETNGKQEMYTRDVHLFRMQLLFTIIDGVTGVRDAHRWSHVFEIGRAEQDQACGSAVSYATKDVLKRQFMIADDSEDPDFKGASGSGPKVDYKSLDGQLVPVISIEPNARKRSDKSPGWFAKDESGQISVALWDTSMKAIDMLMRWNSGAMRGLLQENGNRHRFDAPLLLRVNANQYGLNLAREGQLNTLANPAIADRFMHTARQMMPGLTADQAAEYLDVESIEAFEEDLGAALRIIDSARRVNAADSDDFASAAPGSGDPLGEFGDEGQSLFTGNRAASKNVLGASGGSQNAGSRDMLAEGVDPLHAVHGPPSDEYSDF